MSSGPQLHLVTGDATRPSRKPLRIPISDDDRDMANVLAVLLRDEGNQVQVALRGDDALESCRLFRPDVVIADVNMPGMSGYALANELRQRHGPLAPLLIAISGVWTTPADRVVGKAVGFDHCLLKPCDANVVSALIEPLRSAASERSAAS